MFTGTNLVQGEKIKEPIEYEQFYFDYPADSESETFSKTAKTKDGGRSDVLVAGKKWEGKRPKEVLFSARVFASDEEKQAFISNLVSDASNKLQELFPDTDPIIRMLDLTGIGLAQEQRNKITAQATVKPKDPAKVREDTIKNLVASGQAKNIKMATKMYDAMIAAADEEEEEEAAA